MTDPPPFSSHWVCRLRADLGTMPEIGTLAAGRRRVVPIAGGIVEGPLLRGEILPGGADWQLVAADGSAAIEARYTLRAHDGALAPRPLPRRAQRRPGGAGAPGSRRGGRRGRVLLPQAGHARDLGGRPAWVNGRLFVAVAAREPANVIIELYEIQ